MTEEKLAFANDLKRRIDKLDDEIYEIKVGNKVMCSTGVEGVVVKIYTQASRERQLMVSMSDGRLYHASYPMWTRDYAWF